MLAVGVAHAGKIVKYTLPSGEVIYSDKPPPEATSGEEVQVEPLQSFTVPPAPPLEDSTARKDEKEDEGYQEFKVTSPANDAVIRDNGGNVRISLELEPRLQPDDVIEMFMDGESLGTGRTTTVTMTNVDRGSHTIQAAVRDKRGKRVITSATVTFNLLRAAAGG